MGTCPLEELGFPTERHNSDLSQTNNYGKRLLELCETCDLYIGNGRLGRDRLIGCKTCKGVTVVDYVILSPSLFTFISEFEVLPFDPMISDAHSGIHFLLTSKFYPSRRSSKMIAAMKTNKTKNMTNRKKNKFDL